MWLIRVETRNMEAMESSIFNHLIKMNHLTLKIRKKSLRRIMKPGRLSLFISL